MSDAIVVFVTAPSPRKAEEIATVLVNERLAACGNILPGIRSIYRWEGKLHESTEVLVMLKTQAELFEKLRARVKEVHSYDVPEIVSVRIEAGHSPYLDWIRDSVG